MGRAGVGKTAIVEGLAQRIAVGDVPPALKWTRRILALDHVALLADTSFRGQYEGRLRRVVESLAANPDSILFVDELHNLVGQGTAMGAAMDAGNMLKPALVRGDIRIIGATTGTEYDRWIKNDPALERRFHPVPIEELDAAQTREVLLARRPRLERHHAVAISDDALQAAIVLTDRFVLERARPDKAIDVLDEACAHAQATARVSPELERLIRERRQVEKAIRHGSAEDPAGEPGADLAAEIVPMLERIGAELDRMLSGDRESVPATPAAGSPQTLGDRRAEAGSIAARGAGVSGAGGDRARGGAGGGGLGGEGHRVGGLMRFAPVAAAVVTLLACRQRAEAVQTQTTVRDLVHQTMPAVEEAVGLKFKREPGVEIRSREQIRSYILHKLDEDLPPAEFASYESAYKHLGLIPDSLDLHRLLVDVLTEQVAGYYDPDSGALFIPADADTATLRTTVISHELVHALQDQYSPIDSVIRQRHQNDRRSAGEAIFEGQATLGQIRVLMPEQKIENLPSLWDMGGAVQMQQEQFPNFSHAPLWVKQTLIFPYLAGGDFVKWFWTTHPGEQPYGKLMPVSTSQILHPERFDAHVLPVRISFPTDGDAPDLVDDLGEFETRLVLQQALGSEDQAIALSSGWAGDRYAVYGPKGEALVWYLVWDSQDRCRRVHIRAEKGLGQADRTRQNLASGQAVARRASRHGGRRRARKLEGLKHLPAARISTQQ